MLSRIGAFVDTVGWKSRYRSFSQGWSADSRDGIAFHRTRKAQYRYRAVGNGPTVVFLADPPVTIEAYDELVSVFADEFRVIIVEAAGMGFSAANNQFDFGFQRTNDDLSEFLQAIAGNRSILAFSCVSGLGAIDIAVRYPALVSRLFLLQTTNWDGFLSWKKRRDSKGILHKPIVGQLVMKRLAQQRAPQWLQMATGREESATHLCACAAKGFSHGMSFSLASAFQRYVNGTNPLGSPTQPTTILWGTRDPSHNSESVQKSRMIAPQAQVITRSEMGHFPELEDPHQVFCDLQDALLGREIRTRA